MPVIAHVSDTHFGGPPDARDRAERILAHLLEMDPRPDALVVSGDIADHGLPEEYAEARAVLDTWDGPKIVGTGNHDVREQFVAQFGPAVGVLDVGRTRLVMLDSLVDAVDGVRQDHGVLDADQLAWLDARLAEDDRPTFVSLHHPPVDIGLELMASILLRDPGPFEQVLRRHDHVVATLVGHAHTACATTFAGRPVLIGGGSASTVTMDAERLPRVWEGAPPSFALHLLHDDGRLTTHWRAL
ncbi:MAG TPA: metallophosphoesterase [Nocardioides sp.]|uniref:metallophosphoesterase n=1 Tax=uncultured Nocardioides sp. TaxID=198441 RepID=UPI000ED6C1EA|nr:metallophosphoesterase [uncultured Nocardioides sp.]HCB04746.1 metallophosphoesterase [Nocardioides sp.]HRD64433.1 metallophosphoesterase [Nocardioides sp.]HRI98755.1 metallophosphoesterase [Nocardioides sp.]HRK48577.1 metallophosphoesterase [Nocardioides sp.]